MSFDTILAKSPFIIYQPGGVTQGVTVTTWAEVQAFISLREGAVDVYVDDSITSPALVPTASGITDCEGRVTIKVANSDSQATPVLQIEAGATLRNLLFIVGVEVQSNATTATPSLDYTNPDGGNLSISEFGALSNAATATQPAIVVPAGQTFFLHLDTGDLILNAPAVPLFSLAATSTFTPYFFNASVVRDNYAAGAGNVFLNYDNASAKFFTIPGVPSALPGLTGNYQTVNMDAVLPNPGPQAQATWFIDPQNVTGLADDNNSGIDAAHPVLTYNFGVARKWTTYSPMLRQNTTITWLSSQVGDADPVVFAPITVNAIAVLQGSLGAAQQIGAGNLAGVVAKNRAAAQLLEADLGFAAPIGSLVQNTQAGKSSFAWVYKNVGGTTFALTQPQEPTTVPMNLGTPTAEVDTWANGDTFVVFAPIGANLVDVRVTMAELTPVTFDAPVQIYHLRATSADGVPGDNNVQIGSDITIVESSFDTLIRYVEATDDVPTWFSNCFCTEGLFGGIDDFGTTVLAGAMIGGPFAGVFMSFTLDNDVIVDGATNNSPIIQQNSSALPLVGKVYIDGQYNVSGIGAYTASSLVWGPGFVNGLGTARLTYVAPATSRFQNTGGLRLNTQASANAFDPTSGLWSVLIPITAASLDVAFGAGGFGGLATNVGGASFSSQATP